MSTLPIPSRKCFELIQTMNLERMESDLSKQDLRFILPCLVRMCHCNNYYLISQDVSNSKNLSNQIENHRKLLRRILMPFQEANELKHLLNLDWNHLESIVKKDLQIRLKSIPNSNQTINGQETSFLLSSIIPQQEHQQQLDLSLVNLFEQNNDLNVRMKLVLHELLTLMIHFKNNIVINNNGNQNGAIHSELFDNDIYVDEYVDLIYYAISEMPNTYQLFEVVEMLLLIKNGLPMICRLVANFPDSFHEVCTTLINNSEPQNEETTFISLNRINVLRKLCQMNPSEALIIRSEAVELCRMPNLVVMLTLDHIKMSNNNQEESYTSNSDVISFITGILLSNDEKIRTWFSQYIKRKNPDSSPNNCFLEFREQLLKRFRTITEQMTKISTTNSTNSSPSSQDNKFQNYESIITEACLMLRLYCALRGVAMMKFNEEETQAISKMIVCRPPHIDIGVRFVSVGLCMILAFPQMINSQETEIIEWIKWLVKEENYFGQKANTTASFGEMLLLIAIFFHSNQLSMIGELVSSTIGIKHPLRTNDLTLIKHIFIQDIFTEQTVTSHAIKVPVTKNLNDMIQGALPIHCIYQLLKSRAFTKNKVPIKNWIFNQLCNCVPPIHHILPLLIEAYVNSILIPNTQSGHMTNEPIGEEDLNTVFNRIVYSFEPDQFGKMDSASSEGGDEDRTTDDGTDNDSDNNSGKMDVDDDDTETDDDTNDDDEHDSQNDNQQASNSISCLLTSQLLFLYYVLLYEEVRLNNIRNQDRPSMTYSPEFLSRLPIFYLIQRTQTCPEEYGLLRPPLLRLISYHYPHLCLVKDWLPRPNYSVANHRSLFNLRDRNQVKQILAQRKRLSKLFQKTLQCLKKKCYNKNREPFCYLEQLVKLPDELLWPLASDFIQLLQWVLDVKTPRKLLILVKQIWFRLNHIFPTKLWVMTVNELRAKHGRTFVLNTIADYSWEKIVLDPCIVLRCDQRVFRTPELMEITLHILNGFLQASKINCAHHIAECTAGGGRGPNIDEEKKKREELSKNYTLITDSVAVQMLLECCSSKIDEEIKEMFYSKKDDDDDTDDEDDDDENGQQFLESNLLSNRREVQGLICTLLHQCFIAEWSLARIVSIQGYDPELIPIAVAGIPSMHICLDSIPDLLQYPDLDKKSFAIDLTSHLCVQFPISKSFGMAKLCLDNSIALINLLPDEDFCCFYLSVLPAFGRMCQTFPPLIEGFVKMLVQLAQRNLQTLSARPTCKTIKSADLLEPCLLSDSASFESAVIMAQNNAAAVSGSGENQIFTKFTKSQLIHMSWKEFEQITSKMDSMQEALALAIHKAFALLCQLGPINRVYKDETF